MDERGVVCMAATDQGRAGSQERMIDHCGQTGQGQGQVRRQAINCHVSFMQQQQKCTHLTEDKGAAQGSTHRTSRDKANWLDSAAV